MDINSANMIELFKNFNLIFQKGLEAAPTDYLKFSTEVNSSTAIEVYPFLEQFAGMREWIGDRHIKNLSSAKYEVANRDFEDSVEVERNAIEDDRYGLYSPAFQDLGQASNEIWGELATEALQSGEDNLWQDELTFFSDARKYSDDSIVNNISALALTMDNYATIRNRMLKYRGHNNKTLKVRPGLLICGPDNEGAAFDILKNSRKLTATITGSAEDPQVVTGSVDNGYAGTADILVLHELDSEWFLCDTSRALKPVVVQKRRNPVLTRMDQDNSENVFMRKMFMYGTDARGAAFLSMPHLICGNFPA